MCVRACVFFWCAVVDFAKLKSSVLNRMLPSLVDSVDTADWLIAANVIHCSYWLIKYVFYSTFLSRHFISGAF